MSSRPNDSTFDASEFSEQAPAGRDPRRATRGHTEKRWANDELVSIASTIAELQGQLEGANARPAKPSNTFS
jgi:hypothetical protein